MRAELAASGCMALRVSRCRISKGAIKELDQLIEHYARTDAEIAKLRKANCEDKGRSPDHVVHALMCFEVQQLASRSHRYLWLSAVCKNMGLLQALHVSLRRYSSANLHVRMRRAEPPRWLAS